MNLRSDLKVELVRVDGDWTDVVKSARYSTTMDLKDRERDLRLLRRLWKDQHLSPFEMVDTTWHVEAPILVARQWMRHRTWSYNEFSQRYSESKLEFYFNGEGTYSIQQAKLKSYQQAEQSYQELLAYGVAREEAREVLPLSTFTYFRGKTNFRNLIAFLKLRTPEDVQPQTRELALAMVDILYQHQSTQELMKVCWQGG